MQIIKTSVIENIKHNFEELFPAEKKTAQYILDHLEEVTLLNISQLAKKAHASEASIVRMAKHLGYNGFFQMRLLLSNDVAQKDSDMLNNAPLLTSEKIFSACANRIRSLSSFISTNDLLCAAKLICEARMCHIIGAGNTIPIASDLGFRLQRNGQSCMYSSLPEQYFNNIALGDSSDLVIAISRSGASTQVLKALSLAKKKEMKILVITADPNSQIMDFSDAILQINDTNEMHDQNVRADSHLLELAVNDALIYVIKNYPLFNFDDKLPTQINDVELLLSETKF
ncbi:MAG: MurR/RpiR family transcriptional regulator [Anaerostipes hadrus]